MRCIRCKKDRDESFTNFTVTNLPRMFESLLDFAAAVLEFMKAEPTTKTVIRLDGQGLILED